MGIVFFCQSCGARFEVDAKLAGKKGRCKKCGQPMEIPLAEQIASMAAMPALATAAAAKGSGAATIGSWFGNATSNVGLAPVTVDRMPIGMRRGSAPSPLDDADDSKPYLLAGPAISETRRRSSGRPNLVAAAWRGPLGIVQKVLRFVNETAYLISVPFLIALLYGAAVRNRGLALSAATVVVLLNVARLVTGVINVAVVPLREGLNTRQKKLKKPLRRVVEPAFTIGLVVLAFTFIPWLSTGEPGGGNVVDRLSGGAQSLGAEMRGEVDKASDKAKEAGLDDLAAGARDKLEEVGKGLKKGPAPDGP